MARHAMKPALALGLLLVAWLLRDQPAVRDGLRTADLLPQAPQPQPGAALRKCVGATGITYTNGPCPVGARGHDVDGALTVLPAVAVAAPGAATSAPVRSPLAELAGPPLQGTLKDKAIEGAQ